MSKEKRPLSSSLEEENSPPNRKKSALDESPDDAVDLLLLLSRHPCNPDSTVLKPSHLPHLGAFGHHRHRGTTIRREGIGRVVRFAPNVRPRTVSHVSDDEDERGHDHALKTELGLSDISAQRTESKCQCRDESNVSLFAMALAPPPRLPNVEFGAVICAKLRD